MAGGGNAGFGKDCRPTVESSVVRRAAVVGMMVWREKRNREREEKGGLWV